MMTSANLSTQAWGVAANAAGEVRVCSYEVGVVVWPALWEEEGEEGEKGSVEMVPVFRGDMPGEGGGKGDGSGSGDGSRGGCGNGSENGIGSKQRSEKEGEKERPVVVKTRVGWRMPYDLPLVPYATGEMPWCATEPCEELDWMGRKWPGFGAR